MDAGSSGASVRAATGAGWRGGGGRRAAGGRPAGSAARDELERGHQRVLPDELAGTPIGRLACLERTRRPGPCRGCSCLMPLQLLTRGGSCVPSNTFPSGQEAVRGAARASCARLAGYTTATHAARPGGAGGCACEKLVSRDARSEGFCDRGAGIPDTGRNHLILLGMVAIRNISP